MNSKRQNGQTFHHPFYHPSPFERDIIFKEFLYDSRIKINYETVCFGRFFEKNTDVHPILAW